MTNYGWTNEEGEPIMDGAAYRFEQALDAEYAEQRYMDDNDYNPWDEGEDYECPDCGLDADECECPEVDYVPEAEDAWLDGSWEQ